jgi:hypothetical protein
VTRKLANAPEGDESTESSEDRSIDGPVPDTSVELAFEGTYLVAENHDLEFLVRLGSLARDDKPEEPAEAEVEQREGPADAVRGSGEGPVQGPDRLLVPFNSSRPLHPARHPAHAERYERTAQRLGPSATPRSPAGVDIARRLAEATWHRLTTAQPFTPAGDARVLAADGPFLNCATGAIRLLPST